MSRSLAVVGALFALVVSSVNASGQATPPLRLVRVASTAENAVFLTAAPGEPRRLYIVDKVGLVRITERGRVRAKPFLDVRRSVTAGGEQGLLGLAFHPRYATNRLFYVAYTSANGRNVVERFRSNGSSAILSSRKVLLSVPDPYGNHNGGNLAVGPDGRLYTSIGDGGSGGDPENRSQNMSSRFGKLLRLDVARAGAGWEIAALGLRNPWRFSFDRSTGDLWIGDVGQGSVEEIDYVARGTTGLLNFGWDVYEGTSSFEDKPLGPGRLVQPVYEYSHDVGCSVTGGYVYRGHVITRVSGRYFFGDYCAGTIWSLKLVDGKATGVRSEGIRVAGLSSFGEGPGGELYVLSDDGPVYRIAA
jgi:glucose/arabinose dehydrogenase